MTMRNFHRLPSNKQEEGKKKSSKVLMTDKGEIKSLVKGYRKNKNFINISERKRFITTRETKLSEDDQTSGRIKKIFSLPISTRVVSIFSNSTPYTSINFCPLSISCTTPGPSTSNLLTKSSSWNEKESGRKTLEV